MTSSHAGCSSRRRCSTMSRLSRGSRRRRSSVRFSQRCHSPVMQTRGVNDDDDVRSLVEGEVEGEGIELSGVRLSVEEAFFGFVRFREWEVTELSLGKYCALRAAGDDSVIPLPVFPSRSFRHSAIFVRDDGPVDDPSALAGRRIGVPEWTQTATVYARGLLQHQY